MMRKKQNHHPGNNKMGENIRKREENDNGTQSPANHTYTNLSKC